MMYIMDDSCFIIWNRNWIVCSLQKVKKFLIQTRFISHLYFFLTSNIAITIPVIHNPTPKKINRGFCCELDIITKEPENPTTAVITPARRFSYTCLKNTEIPQIKNTVATIEATETRVWVLASPDLLSIFSITKTRPPCDSCPVVYDNAKENPLRAENTNIFPNPILFNQLTSCLKIRFRKNYQNGTQISKKRPWSLMIQQRYDL